MKKVRTKQRGASAETCALVRARERDAVRTWRAAPKAPMNRLPVASKRAAGATAKEPRSRTVRCVPTHTLNVLARGAIVQLQQSDPELASIADGELASVCVSDAAAFRAQLAASTVLQAIVALALETQTLLGDSSKRLRGSTVKMAARTVFARLGEPAPLEGGAIGVAKASKAIRASRTGVAKTSEAIRASRTGATASAVA